MAIFHLSLPVANVEKTRFFYCSLLNGKPEKTTAAWFNVNLEGHQLTFHDLPNEVITSPFLHWGLVVSWAQFHQLFDRLKAHDTPFKQLPYYQDIDTDQERVKMVFVDPSGYLLEYKAYKNEPKHF